MDNNFSSIIAGCLTGHIQVFISQPFEIVKTRLQYQQIINPPYKGVTDCFRKIYKQEGLLAFYKGTLAPLVGIGLQSSTLFFSYEFAKNFFLRFMENPNEKIPIQYIMASGVFTGLFTSLIGCSTEHVRIRIQIQKNTQTQQFTGSIDAASKIVKRYGITTLYRGYLATVVRSCFGNIIYFGTYETILRSIITNYRRSFEAPIYAQSISGALAGVVAFWSIYPIDYVKTLLQTDSLQDKKQRFHGIRQAFRYILQKKGGLKGLYRGSSIAYCRSALANGIGFPVFQAIRARLNSCQKVF